MAKYVLVSPNGNETPTDDVAYATRLQAQGYTIKRDQKQTQPMRTAEKPRKNSDPGEVNGRK